MATRFSDDDIARMLHEPKLLPAKYSARIQLRDKRGHKERELEVDGAQGNKYRLILRLNTINSLDFSIILAYLSSDTNQLFRLRRYNGKSHEHTNHIEGNSFYDFHIHQATERYQDLGGREDSYAEPTDRFADYHTALQCLLDDCEFEPPEGSQQTLFGEFDL